MGVMLITGLNTLIFWGLVHVNNPNDANYIIPLVAVVIFSFIVCQVFLGLFDDAIRAILMSLAVDMDLNGGSPKYGPPTFHEKLQEIFDDRFANDFNKDNTKDPLINQSQQP